ncbi:MAG: penicillin acylase family protein [Flavobacteriales bacterium]|nr:MAG: penicillin acylase family protein [Flavobacteriales bacterium]
MRTFKKVFKILLVILVILLIVGFFSVKHLQPTYSGTKQLKNLTGETTVFYDDFGVPHIFADNELDAQRVLGYVHAQDRLWQMELLRRLVAGRLSEIFGKESVRTDKMFSGLGIEEAATKTIANLDKNSPEYKLSMAYLDGVNQFIKNGPTPVEYYLLGLDKEEFTIKDMYNVFGYMAFSFAVAHKTDPLLTKIKEKLGVDYLKELNIPVTDTSAVLVTEKNAIVSSGLAQAVNDIYKSLLAPVFIGSNSWVLGPQRTKNGKVIFANDPHIGFAQPSVWYQAHVKTQKHEMYGYYLALTPFPLLGHNRNYAYGLTMFENDDIDFYIEENHPDNSDKYKTPSGYKNYETIQKTIKIKDENPINYTIKVSNHGPIMNDIVEHIEDERPIAMSWIYTQLPNQLLEATYQMSHAGSLLEFKNATALIHAPGLNVMYGDAKDNIAWFAAGKLYELKSKANTKTYLDGPSGKDDKLRYLPFDDNPQAINPHSQYVYSANNQPDSVNGRLYPGYYLPEDRALRIEHLIEKKATFSKKDVQNMILDVTNSVISRNIKNAFKEVSPDNFSKKEQSALQILQQWDGNYSNTKIAPTIYNRFLYEFNKNTYADELGKNFDLYLNTQLRKSMDAVQMAKDSSVWWDNIKTTDIVETKKDVVIKSLKNAVEWLTIQLGEDIDTWVWNRVYSLEYNHPMGQVAALRSYFNVGPFNKVNGGNEVINNLMFSLDSTGIYKVKAGPSTRRVIDFSDVENSVSILPTGQSGNPLSKHYKDQADKYINGQFVPMHLNIDTIKQFKDKLVFKPQNL